MLEFGLTNDAKKKVLFLFTVLLLPCSLIQHTRRCVWHLKIIEQRPDLLNANAQFLQISDHQLFYNTGTVITYWKTFALSHDFSQSINNILSVSSLPPLVIVSQRSTVCSYPELLKHLFIFTFMHLADAFIQRDLQCIQAIHLLSVCVFPGDWTHDLCAANAMLYHWATWTLFV